MTTNPFAVLQDFQNVLVVCPDCGEIHRLSDLKLSFRGKAKRTWWDSLVENEAAAYEAEEGLHQARAEIKERARKKGLKQLPKLLKRCAPVICSRGYFPQDVKALFDPVDFVIFDGMNEQKDVRRVVLLDGPPNDRRRETAQRSIKAALKKGNYEWRTVRMDDNGQIKA